MKYVALACDYDGTLADEGRVDEETIESLRRVLSSGRKLILLTGRTLEDLFEVFSAIELFNVVVCENGAVLYLPGTREMKVLAERPPDAFILALKQKGVKPLSIGRSVVATWHPSEATALETIHELGLDLQISFNEGAVMVLPPGVNKGTGLRAALSELGLSEHNVVGVGNAENDHVFLQLCEISFAVSNALPIIRDNSDRITKGASSEGVREIVQELTEDDLLLGDSNSSRQRIVLGKSMRGEEVSIFSHGAGLLITGPSQSGKSTVTKTVLEQLTRAGYQVCVVDPEGEYATVRNAVTIGNNRYPPQLDDVLKVLNSPDQNVVINLMGLPLAERPTFFANLLPDLHKMRRTIGRPHWILADEAHHMLHPYWDNALSGLPEHLAPVILVTVHPDQLSQRVLSSINTAMVLGVNSESTLQNIADCFELKLHKDARGNLEKNEAFVWFIRDKTMPRKIELEKSHLNGRRHLRKYADGDVGVDRSFYFRGPRGKLNLRAQNLFLFVQIAAGIDDDTWLHHLHNGDYSRWFRNVIRDSELSDETRQMEQSDVSAEESRHRIARLIEGNYSFPTRIFG